MADTETTITPQEFVKEWVKALRSGDYVQTKGTLTKIYSDGSAQHCCLGVACEIAVKHGMLEKHEKALFDGSDFLKAEYWANPDDCEVGVMPESLTEFLNSDDPNGRQWVENGFRSKSLSTLNDDFDYTFDQIADVIEEHTKVD